MRKRLLVGVITIGVSLFGLVLDQKASAATTDSRVTLSGGGKTYHGVFVAGSGRGIRTPLQEGAFKKARDKWKAKLKDSGEGWAEERMDPLDQPTFKDLCDAIDKWKDVLDPNDEFHLYFVGHADEAGSVDLKDTDLKGLPTLLNGFKRGVTISLVVDTCNRRCSDGRGQRP